MVAKDSHDMTMPQPKNKEPIPLFYPSFPLWSCRLAGNGSVAPFNAVGRVSILVRESSDSMQNVSNSSDNHSDPCSGRPIN